MIAGYEGMEGMDTLIPLTLPCLDEGYRVCYYMHTLIPFPNGS